MNEQSSSPPAEAPARDRGVTNRLLLFFALVYVVEGVGQVGGLIAQPLSFYLKQVHGWTPLQVTAYLPAVLSLCSGFSAMLATVATVTLAADYCPQRSEGFSFAVMMSIINLATATADIVGSFLFEHFFYNRLAPLIIVSAAFTAFAFVLVPLLRLGDKRQGQWVGVLPAGGPEAGHIVRGVVNE